MSVTNPPAEALWPYAPEQANPERMGFIVCFATAIHLCLILGLGFSALKSEIQLPSIEVTLARYQSEQTPDKADYLAQFDQQGSGQLEHKAEPTTTTQSAFHDNQSETEKTLKIAKSSPSSQQRAVLETSSNSASSSPSKPREFSPPSNQQGQDEQTELSQNISALEAQLAELNQAYASLPRPKFITSVATRGSPDAIYLNRWEDHIEAIGNKHYPEEARKQGIEGELRVLILLFPDGRIDEVRILQSSGQPILDRATRRILRLAAPFEPIPPEVLGDKNRLGIVRTWRFENTRLTAQ
ncbi:energy transducer TonB [Spongiibacter sp. KMU-158]|uniref:Energy transducer TonB n=1 Tax=Spongiibacter pelagi TaxID=2760804 RepID=A0A927GU99_9GAMM|nr:energy transducer TonB [Spongiibacter pelagi]MBD2857386.1 energy transducer TonB [Spongiibacter pelagi]